MRRSLHSLSHFRNFTGNMGELIPAGLVEVYPGDTFQHAVSLLVRTTPLVAPVMHPVHVRVHHVFIPNRLIWANGKDDSWEAFITGGHDGLDASVLPTITVNSGSGFAVGSLADYLGLPTGVDDLPVSALPFRAYALAYNHLFMDQDLDTELVIDTTGGPDTTTNQALQTVAWEKDYFTTARPWTQKGSVISLPLGSRANVLGIGTQQGTFNSTSVSVNESSGSGSVYANARKITQDAAEDLAFMEEGGGSHGGTVDYPNIYADLSNATSATINDLREAIQLQAYKEARALYGSRYVEYLRYLGIRGSDARLQRVELLGSGRQTIQFSEVLQQSPTTSGTPNTGLGTMAGHGIAATRSNRYRKFFEEHGYVMSLFSCVPKSMYVTGLPRHFSYTTKEDFWQKELEGIGAQEVLNKELYWADTGPNDVFGYQDRYDHLRRQESSVHGDFRGSTLDDWHFGRIFTSDVALNSAFIKATQITRSFQSTSTDTLLVMAMHSLQARRLVKRVGVPSKIF